MLEVRALCDQIASYSTHFAEARAAIDAQVTFLHGSANVCFRSFVPPMLIFHACNHLSVATADTAAADRNSAAQQGQW